MATKNGICKYCHFTRIENHIFPVNPEASTVYCPYCMRELDPKEAINLYSNLISNMLDKADNTLYVACDPVLAYQEYADVLEIEPKNQKALLGRILCLIYNSRVKQSYLQECSYLLDAITHRNAEEIMAYIGFLKKINLALDEYDDAVFHKVTHRDFFYDEECVKLYIKRLADIIKFKKEIIAHLSKIKKDYVTQTNEVLINLISHSVTEKEAKLKSVKHTVDGLGFKYNKIVNDKVYLERLDEVVSTNVFTKQIRELTDERKKKILEGKVFRDYTVIIGMKKASLWLSGLFLLAFIGLGICAYLFRDNNSFFITFIAAGITSFIAFIVCASFYLSWRRILKKRKLRIN